MWKRLSRTGAVGLPGLDDLFPAHSTRELLAMANPPGATPRVPRITLTTFAEYLSARSSKRIDCIRDQIRTYQQDYHPGPSFYRDFVEAVVKGRRTGADHLVVQGVAQAQHNITKRDHYTTLAAHWLAMPKLHLPLVRCGSAAWITPRLTVGVRPDFAVSDGNGNVFVIKLWLKEQELAPDAANAILRLLDLHMNELASGGSPLVVDVRREKVHRKTRRPMKLGFDHWMESEARGLAELWEKLTAA